MSALRKDDMTTRSDRKPNQTPPASGGPIRIHAPPTYLRISVKLGSSAVAEFGFGLRLWGCRWNQARPPGWGGVHPPLPVSCL